MKTLLLGIDGLDPDLADEFDLPNLERIGEFHEIDTYGNSGPSWVTVMTGLRPRDHGVLKLGGDGNEDQNRHSWQGESIWEKVDGYSGIANVPLTYPPATDMDGWMVTGVMTPRRAIYTYPRSLQSDLDDMGYRIDMWEESHENHPHGHYGTVPFSFDREHRNEMLEELHDVIDSRGRAYKWLIENEPVDFAFLCFTALDRVQHFAFDNEWIVARYYALVDYWVGEILDTIPDDTDVIATSDHGFQRIDYPDTDMTGEHRHEGWAATTLDAEPADLHDIHDLAVASANATDGVNERLRDLGYID